MIENFFLGWREDFNDPSRHVYLANVFKPTRNPTYAEATVNMAMKNYSFVACVSDRSFVHKNRYNPNEYNFDLPYVINQESKTVRIHPKDKPEAFKCLVSWILDHSIDLNHITEVDEFTLLMLAE